MKRCLLLLLLLLPRSHLPKSIPRRRRSLCGSMRGTTRLTRVGTSARRLLRRHLQGPHSVWIQKLLTLHRLSRLKGQVMRFEGEYDDPPVPSLLLVFRENDAIQACFDHESERYNETTNEPSCAVSFRPEIEGEFDAALRTMAIFLRSTWTRRSDHPAQRHGGKACRST